MQHINASCSVHFDMISSDLALPFIVIAHSMGEERRENLQALRVVRVQDGASVSTSTDGRTSPIYTTALAIVGSDSSAGRSGRGSSARGRGSAARGLTSGGSRRAAGGGAARSTAKSRVERSNPDVGVDDIGATRLRLDGLRVTRGCSAATTSSTRGTGLVCGVGAVEPEHVDGVVVPQTHDQDHTFPNCSTHVGQTAVFGEGGSLVKGGELSSTEVGVDDISADSGDLGTWLGDDNTVLNVVTSDLGEGTSRSAVASDKLSHNGEWLGGVDSQAGAVEVSVTETVRVEITSVGVAGTGVTVTAVGTTAGIGGADGLRGGIARMRSQGL